MDGAAQRPVRDMRLTIRVAGCDRRATCRVSSTWAKPWRAMLRCGRSRIVRSAFAPSRNGRWPAAGRWLPCSHPVPHAMHAGHEPHQRTTGGDDDHETDDSQAVRIGDRHVRCHGDGAIRRRSDSVAAVCSRHPAMPLGRRERFADRMRADRSVALRFRRDARHVTPAPAPTRPHVAQRGSRGGAMAYGCLSLRPRLNHPAAIRFHAARLHPDMRRRASGTRAVSQPSRQQGIAATSTPHRLSGPRHIRRFPQISPTLTHSSCHPTIP